MRNAWRMFRSLLAVLRRPDVVGVRPLHFQLEPAVGCNLLCQTCQVPGRVATRAMPLDRFKQAFDQIRPLKIGLSGAGEPFLNKDLLDIVAYAKRNDASVLTTTNFTLCHNKIEAILDSGLDLIKVSLDAATAPNYARIRGQDFFDRILADLRELQEAKRRRGVRKPFVRLQFVLQHDNLDELAAMIGLASDLGADSVYYQPLETLLIPERKSALTEGVSMEALRDRLADANARARDAGIGTNAGVLIGSLPAYFRKYAPETPAEPPARVCLLPWFSVYITVDGDVRPCCSFGEGETLVMGNLFQEPFERIWNSEKYRAFRRASQDRRLSYLVCRNCTPNRLRDFLDLSAVLPGFFRPCKIKVGT